MWWMLKDSKGYKSSTLTFAVIGLSATVYSIIVGSLETIKIGDFTLSFTSPDATIVLGLLGATVTAYVMRRNKSDQLESDKETSNKENWIIE